MPTGPRLLALLGLLAGCAHPAGEPLLGTDADGDGVRDDVQRRILQAHPDLRPAREALLQLARAYQGWLRVGPREKAAAYAAAERSDRAIACLYQVLPADRAYPAVGEVKAMVLDTVARQLAYEAVDAQLGGGVFTTPCINSGTCCEREGGPRPRPGERPEP